jgi:serine/threonine protein kinase
MFVCTRCKREVVSEGLFCPFCGAAARPAGGEPGDPFVGQMIADKYFVHQLLGRGGMGKVYKATHITLDRPVVLKILDRSLLTDPSIVQRFHREARAASRLNHPNSINVVDFGEAADGTLFIAMEYLPGRSLSRIIADEFPLEPARIIKIGSQILAALTEAHPLGVLHRDLKPENVIVESRRDEADFVKVLDFGIAKLNEPGEASGPRLTQAGMVCGTPGYMSPEQARGAEIDARSDLYSVGVILYELVTGKLPFEADTPLALVAKVLVEQPTPPSVRRPDVAIPPDLEALIMRALSTDPAGRPASAEEFRNDLLACVVPEPRPARPTPRQGTVVLDPKVALAGAKRPASGPGVQRWPSSPVAQVPRITPSRSASSQPQASSAGDTPARPSKPPRHEMDDEVGGGEELEGEPGPSSARHSQPATSRSKPLVIAGSAVAALLLMALVTWGLARNGGKKPAVASRPEATKTVVSPVPPPAPTPVLAATPPTSPPPLPENPSIAEPAPSPPGPSPAVAPEAAPPGGAAALANASTPSEPVHRRRGPAIRAVRDALNSLRTPPASSGEGVLSVVATPWAIVSINGHAIGETPREVRLAEGAYRVRASHPTLGMTEAQITIVAGKRKLWSATFTR